MVIGFVLRCKNIKIRVTWNTLADFFPALSGVEGKIGLIFLAFLSTWHLLFIIDYLLFVRNAGNSGFYAFGQTSLILLSSPDRPSFCEQINLFIMVSTISRRFNCNR